MFVRPKSWFADRLWTAAQLVRAFAFLEDPVDWRRPSQPAAEPATLAPPVLPHPHSARLVRETRRRRPGTTAPRPALCLTPVSRPLAGPMRRKLPASRRLHPHRAGPHDAS